jgi:hypothetical protein
MDVNAWITAYGAAWRTRDPDAAAALFAESAVYRSTVFREPHVGRDGIRAYWATATATQSDAEVRFGEPVVEGRRAAVEWWMVMRDEGAWVTLPGCLLLRFDGDDLCEELREYWHLEDGRHEPPPGWGV